MSTLICFGLGYSARRYIADFGGYWGRIIVTKREAGPLDSFDDIAGRRFEAQIFDGSSAPPALRAAVEQADAVLSSIPPADGRDPVLAHFRHVLANRPRQVVYLSTIGVYGDHAGGFVDEATTPRPASQRSVMRLSAENAWSELGRRTGQPAAIFRIAGIYGPGRNVLLNLAKGKASRIIKPGQVFNRIHVADLAQAINAAFTHNKSGLYNIADDLPAPASDVVRYAAELLRMSPPPEVLYSDARISMPEMARSFYEENKRARNDKLKRELGVQLLYPTYRDGLSALCAAGDHTFIR